MAGAIIASPSPAAVSWLYYANRLYELPLGVVSIAIASALAPAIAAGLRSGASARLAAAQSRAIEITLGLALPSAVAFAVLAGPLARGLFERGAFGPNDTAAVAAALAAMAVGLPGHALEKVLGAVSFAHEDTRTPMLAALAGLTTALAGALALFPRYGHVGIAAAIAISGWIGATLLTIVLARRNWLHFDGTAWRRLPRIALATAVMTLAIVALQIALAPAVGSSASSLVRIGLLLVFVAGGLAVYLAALQVLCVAHLRDLVSAIRYEP
jgi:putative peptidoglycan lipid II flippase